MSNYKPKKVKIVHFKKKLKDSYKMRKIAQTCQLEAAVFASKRVGTLTRLRRPSYLGVG